MVATTDVLDLVVVFGRDFDDAVLADGFLEITAKSDLEDAVFVRAVKVDHGVSRGHDVADFLKQSG